MGHLSYHQENVKQTPSVPQLQRVPRNLLAHVRRELPKQLRLIMEELAGLSLHAVEVHHHSANPARFGARAYAHGNQIYLSPGQEAQLAHELWHVVQQKQGRVMPTAYVQGQAINDDPRLEQEATHMGALALHLLATGAFPRARQRSIVLPHQGLMLPVIQFTLEDAIAYAKKELGATDSDLGVNDEQKRQWLINYMSDLKNPREHQIRLKQEHDKPAPLPIPDALLPFFPQTTQRPLIDNNNFTTWKAVSTAVRAVKPPDLGLGGVVPDIDLRTMLVTSEGVVTQPVFTQLNPMSSGSIDVKSTAFPNMLHTHQNMAAKAGLGEVEEQEDEGKIKKKKENVVSVPTPEARKMAGNVMRTMKRTSIQHSESKTQKPLEPISKDASENAKAWNIAVAFATELGIAESSYGGAAAVAQAMATLYVIKHGGALKWSERFFGTGTGGRKKLAKLRNDDEQTRDDALSDAYESLATYILKIFEEKHAQLEDRNRDELSTWLTTKFTSWTAGYEAGFDAAFEVNTLLVHIAAQDPKYQSAEQRVRTQSNTRPTRRTKPTILVETEKIITTDDKKVKKRSTKLMQQSSNDDESPTTKRKKRYDSSDDESNASVSDEDNLGSEEDEKESRGRKRTRNETRSRSNSQSSPVKKKKKTNSSKKKK